ncbi:MAG: hypothetical protein FH762_09120 [Firmicutes bacterium]|nr:hypothetical protein [Bacillota bacterium]
MTLQTKSAKLILILVFIFSFNVLASSNSIIEETLLVYFDDIGIIEKDLLINEEELTETEFNKWLNIVLNYNEGLTRASLDKNVTLTYNEASVYLLEAINQKEFVYTYLEETNDMRKYWQAAKIVDIFAILDHKPEPDDIVNKINGLKLIYTAMDRLGLIYDLPVELQDLKVYGKINNILSQIHTKNLIQTDTRNLFSIGNKGLLEITDGTFTGYTIKDLSERAMLDYSKTIRYGHSSFSHLFQLISLLRREGFNARIAVEGRISSYIHLLKEWGQPPAYVDTTGISDEKCIVHAKEYDLLIEFPSLAEKEAFAAVIQKYAQKEVENQPGLIKNSWFVPLYTSTTPLPGFVKVSEIRGKINGYTIISYALDSVAQELKGKLEGYNPVADFEVNDIWINESFLSYLDSSVE